MRIVMGGVLLRSSARSSMSTIKGSSFMVRIRSLASINVCKGDVRVVRYGRTSALDCLFSRAAGLRRLLLYLVMARVVSFFRESLTKYGNPNHCYSVFYPMSRTTSSWLLFHYLARHLCDQGDMMFRAYE